jgi:hypothetical protein
MTGNVKGGGVFFFSINDRSALEHYQGSRAGQSGFNRFEWLNAYLPLVDTPVIGIGFFCIGVKRGFFDKNSGIEHLKPS